MSSRLLSAAVAAFFLTASAPAVAQQAAPPAPQAEAAPLDEAAMDAAGDAFGVRMEAMQAEMQNVLTAAGGDKDKAKSDLDAIQARYQPEADAFAETLTTFLRTKLAAMPADQQAEMQEGLARLGPVIRGIPAQVRGQVEAPPTESDPEEPTATPST